MLERLAVEAPGALAGCLPDVVPRVSECMVDAKDQVKVRARPRRSQVGGVLLVSEQGLLPRGVCPPSVAQPAAVACWKVAACRAILTLCLCLICGQGPQIQGKARDMLLCCVCYINGSACRLATPQSGKEMAPPACAKGPHTTCTIRS